MHDSGYKEWCFLEPFYGIYLMKKFRMMTGALIVTLPITCAEATQSWADKVWTGWYGGVEGGFVFNQAHISSEHPGFTSESGTCNGGENFSSFFPGVQFGYLREMQNRLVVGAEGNITYNVSQSKYYQCQCPFNNNVSDSFVFRNRKQGAMTGRLGYAMQAYGQSILPFLMAGISVADLGLTYKNEGGDAYSENINQVGWLAGLGMEWAFHQHWSLRAEYFYTDYGNNAVNMKIPVVYKLVDSNAHADMRLRANTIEIALNYWF